MQSYLVLFRLCFCMYKSRNKKLKNFVFIRKKQTHEKTKGGAMKRSLLDFVGYEMTNGEPMKRP